MKKNFKVKSTMNNSYHENSVLLKKIKAEDSGMIFIAGSGVEQIGMNLNIFGYNGKFIIVDVGISFCEMGSGIMLPSTKILEDLEDKNILAYVLTHAHEDHIGGLCKFLKKFNKPIYSTSFTMRLIEEKLKENNLMNSTKRTVVFTDKVFKIEDFSILFTNTTHSIPDSNHIIISTPDGNIFHTGDWKFDESPVIGNPPNLDLLKSIGEKFPITALINDSTNAQEFKKIGTEMEAQEGLRKHILENKGKRITVTCFSSNLARLKSLQKIAKETGRILVLIGTSLLKITKIGLELNLINEENLVINAKKVSSLECGKTLYVCTGSQGEVNSVLYKSSMDLHPILKIQKDDVIIFSSRIIPGNEKKITDIKNSFLEKGVKIIDHNTPTEDTSVIHVSGHPGQQDILDLISIIKPKHIIPVHGDLIHLSAVKDLVSKIHLPCILPKGNGSVFRIHSQDGVELIGKLDTTTDVVDGNNTYSIYNEIFKQRQNLYNNGIIFICLNKNKKYFLFNYGAVSYEQWKYTKNQIINIIEDDNILNLETLRNNISFWFFKKYNKYPIIILNKNS